MKHLRITPDSRLDNVHVDNLAQTLCIYSNPLERWNGRGFTRPNFISFETVLEKENTAFYVTVPDELESVAKKAIETVWPKSAVEDAEEPFDKEPDRTAAMSLNNHYMFAIKVDRRKLGALPAILETIRALEEGEKVFIQTVATPADNGWFMEASNAYERFKKGEMPQKLHFTKKGLVQSGVKLAAKAAYEVASITSEIITGKELEKLDLDGAERAAILKDGSLSQATLKKPQAEAYEVEIRIGVIANNDKRSIAIMRMVTMAFRELDGDNQLKPHETKPKKVWDKMLNRKVSALLNKDFFSISELSRLHMLPTGEYQEKYHIPNIRDLQIEANSEFTQGGMLLGHMEIKKKVMDIFQQVMNHDVLCLPRTVIGGMGSGKTTRYAANFVVEAVLNGFGALAIDPKDGQIRKEVEAFLEPHQIIKIEFGKIPISLDWREAERSPKAKNRLANTILGFFNTSNEEAGPQTARYIRAAVIAMRTGRLAEIMQIFEDDAYRETCMMFMKEGIHKTTLKSFGEESESRRRQILSPIYNRLDIILGDEYLSECMETQEGIDLVEIMEQKKAVIIDVPKGDLGPEAVNLIVNLISTKLDLAMTLRSEDKRHPFFAIFDEPHQFLKSVNTWKAATVESRHWRLGYVFLFHSWEQIPDSLAEIIKSAGPHYTLFNCSKKTYKDLADEIAPYNYADGLNLKRFHCINVLRSSEGVEKPFICRIADRPSDRKKKLVSLPR